MNIKIDSKFLADVGLRSLPAVEAKVFRKHVQETLEMRVGTRIAKLLSDDQLDEIRAILGWEG